MLDVPLFRGGSNGLENLKVLFPQGHAKKNQKKRLYYFFLKRRKMENSSGNIFDNGVGNGEVTVNQNKKKRIYRKSV